MPVVRVSALENGVAPASNVAKIPFAVNVGEAAALTSTTGSVVDEPTIDAAPASSALPVMSVAPPAVTRKPPATVR